MFEVAGLLSGYERALARERVVAGQRRAVLSGVRVGRPPLPAATLREVRAALASGAAYGRRRAPVRNEPSERAPGLAGDGGEQHRQG